MKDSYNVEVPDELVYELRESFTSGAIIELFPDGSELAEVRKVGVVQFNGLKVSIKANEHPPPHFHVSYQNSDASFRIDNGEKLNGQGQILKYENNIKKWWKKNKQKLIDVWNSTRPADCQVGLYKEARV